MFRSEENEPQKVAGSDVVLIKEVAVHVNTVTA